MQVQGKDQSCIIDLEIRFSFFQRGRTKGQRLPRRSITSIDTRSSLSDSHAVFSFCSALSVPLLRTSLPRVSHRLFRSRKMAGVGIYDALYKHSILILRHVEAGAPHTREKMSRE